jgi:hypothetical protein
MFINEYYNQKIFDIALQNKIMLNKISNKRINNEYKLLSQKYNINELSNEWEIKLNDIILKVLFFDYPINGAVNCNLMSQSYWSSTI